MFTVSMQKKHIFRLVAFSERFRDAGVSKNEVPKKATHVARPSTSSSEKFLSGFQKFSDLISRNTLKRARSFYTVIIMVLAKFFLIFCNTDTILIVLLFQHRITSYEVQIAQVGLESASDWNIPDEHGQWSRTLEHSIATFEQFQMILSVFQEI